MKYIVSFAIIALLSENTKAISVKSLKNEASEFFS